VAQGYEIDIDGIQHQFYRHEHDNNVPSRNESEDAYRKDHHTEQHVPA
jgi:hypothetical protein